jgi:hypothetical protein
LYRGLKEMAVDAAATMEANEAVLTACHAGASTAISFSPLYKTGALSLTIGIFRRA